MTSSVEHFVEVPMFQLVSASFGEAIFSMCTTAASTTECRSRLEASEDGGRTWTDLMGGPTRRRFVPLDLFSLDAYHGWLVSGDCARGNASLLRTRDGGRSWQELGMVPSTCHAGGGSFLGFIDPERGWMTFLDPPGEIAYLRTTLDGGRTWGPRRPLPVAGRVAFTDPDVGWLVPYPFLTGGPSLYRTADAGRTWRAVRIARPPCCAPRSAIASLPTFSGSHGVLPVQFRTGEHVVIAFERTTDGGDTWRAGPPLRLHRRGDHPAGIAVAGTGTWWVTSPDGRALFRTTDGGAHWHASPLPTGARASLVSAVNAREGWVEAATAHDRAALFVTHDGGATWRVPHIYANPNRGGVSADIRNVAPLPGAITSLVASPDGVLYGEYSRRHVPHIVRFDPATRSIARTAVPDGRRDAGIAYAGGSVWVATGATQPTRSWLERLDPGSLASMDRIQLPARPVGLAAVPAGIWVAAGRSLVLIDASTGSIVRTRTFAGAVRLLSADPSGGRLYVATSAPVHHDATPLMELDARTGDRLATAWQGEADLRGPSDLAGSDDGVWVTEPTGMMASLFLRRASDLDRTAAEPVEGPNSLTDSVAAGRLWITQVTGGYACASTTTGHIVGYVGLRLSTPGDTDVVATRSGLYVGGWSGIEKLAPDPACLR